MPAMATPLQSAYVGAVKGAQFGLNMDATAATSPTTPQALAAPRVAITAAALPENSCSAKHKQLVKVNHTCEQV